jgi:hypothetical protein
VRPRRCRRCGKLAYESEWQAQEAANVAGPHYRDYDMRPYWSEDCGCWHIGHPPGTGERSKMIGELLRGGMSPKKAEAEADRRLGERKRKRRTREDGR